jgi:hypothetical protein
MRLACWGKILMTLAARGVPAMEGSQRSGLDGAVSTERPRRTDLNGPALGLNNRFRPADRRYTHAEVSIPNPTEDNLRPSWRSLK